MSNALTVRASAVALLLAVCGPALAASAGDGGFSEIRRTKDGITISRKAGKSKGFYVTRFDTVTKADPGGMVESLWQSFFKNEPPVVERKFIRRDKDDLVFHDKVKTPVVSDRDYTMRVQRSNKDGTHTIRFKTAPELGPPPDPAYVRMPLIEGFWQVSPNPEGGSIIRYEVYSEPGGSVPAFIVRDPQVNEALSDFRRSIQNAAVSAR